MTRALFAGPCLVLLAACAKPPVDTAADVAAINAVREREMAAFKGGMPDSLVAVFAADAVIMPPNEPQLNGAAAFRAWAAAADSMFTVEGGYTESSVTVAGDWAIDRYTGALTMTPKAGGAAMQERVRGVHILQRQADGRWLITSDIWNSETPLAPPPPPARR